MPYLSAFLNYGCKYVPELSALFNYGCYKICAGAIDGCTSVPELSAYCIKAVRLTIYVVVEIIVDFDAALHQAHY